MALGLVTAPAVPAVGSANQVVNNVGMPLMIVMTMPASQVGVGIGEAGATLTANVSNLTATAVYVYTILLMPGQAIAFFTNAITSWTWFGLS